MTILQFMKKNLLCLCLFLGSFISFSQDNTASLAQNPASMRWSQIKTPHFNLIFPKEIQNVGNRTANLLETVYAPVSKSLGRQPRPIAVILQNQTAISNGFVSLFPRRSEFFTTPPQDYTLLGNNNWIDLLAVHEFRHVVQNDKALIGVTKTLYTLLGNNGLGVVTSLVVPNWFFEGDAVGTESVLTLSGRGRIPSFDMALRTQLLTNAPFSYAKAVTSSFKNYVPNHYVSGYVMTSYLKNKFGGDAWNKILENTYKNPFYPFSFSNNIRKITGLRVEQLYQASFEDIAQQWKTQVQGINESTVKYLKTTKNSFYTNYQYPQLLSNGRVIALKSGLADIQQLVLLDSLQQEQKIWEVGIFNDGGTMSAAGNKVVWAEFRTDARWGQRNYSEIKLFDIITNTCKRLTTHTKLSVPAIAKDEKKLVAVENKPNNQQTLVVVDAEQGTILNTLPNPQNALYIHPIWGENNKIYAVKLLNGLKNIVEIDEHLQEEKALFAPLDENIAHPVKAGHYVFYNSGITGIDNIFAVDLNTQQKYQVTNRKFGAFNPTVSADGKTLIFNDFSAGGHRIVTANLTDSSFIPLEQSIGKPIRYFGQMLMQEAGENLLKNIPLTQYPVKPFRKSNIFNIYSWGPLFNATSGNTLNVGISSQDLLSTTAFSTGYSYNPNEKVGQYYANVSYQGWYPKFNFSYTNGQRKTQVALDKDPSGAIDSLKSDTWTQVQYLIGLSLPFNLTRSKYTQSLSFGVNAAITQVTNYDLERRPLSQSFNGTVSSMIYTASYSRQVKRAVRDIAPRWGQALTIYVRNLPFSNDLQGGIRALQSTFLVPGFQKHHSIRLRGGIQHEEGHLDPTGAPNPNQYVFSSPMFFPRGYSYRAFTNLSVASIDYRLPLFEPDWNIGRLLFIKRVKLNLFADIARGETKYTYSTVKNGNIFRYRDDIQNYTTFGIDLSAQFHFLRFPSQFEGGVRATYLKENGQFLIEPLVIDVGF